LTGTQQANRSNHANAGKQRQIRRLENGRLFIRGLLAAVQAAELPTGAGGAAGLVIFEQMQYGIKKLLFSPLGY